MFFTSHDLAQSHQRTLNNLLSLSTTCLKAGEQLGELAIDSSRQWLTDGPRTWPLGNTQETLWLRSTTQASRLLDQSIAVVGEVHKAWLTHGEIQIRQFDELLIAALRRAEKLAPWEIQPTLALCKLGIASNEQAVHGLQVAASEAIAMAGEETHQLIENLQPAH